MAIGHATDGSDNPLPPGGGGLGRGGVPSWTRSPWLAPVGLIIFGWLFVVAPGFRVLVILLAIGGVMGWVALAPYARRRAAMALLARDPKGRFVEDWSWADLVFPFGIDPAE